MTPATLLVVEDDRVVARDIAQQVSRIGHTVAGIVSRGDDVLPWVLERRPDLVLMDVRLEGSTDGITAAQKIRELCPVPVIYLTAYADDETLRRASATEPFGYLLKPFEDSQLRTAIEIALYKHAAERKLRESERRYATTLSSIGDAVISTDAECNVTFMNPVAESLTGWEQTEAIGHPLHEVFFIVNEDTRERIEDPAAKVFRLGVVVGLANHTILLTRDGRALPIDDCASPIINDDGKITGAVLVFRDITEKRQMGDALRTAQADLTRVSRLTTMGVLAASIAHEVNQPLMALVTNAETCLLRLGEDPPHLSEAHSAAERIVDNGHRIGRIIQTVRSLASQTPPTLTRLNLNEMIREVLDLLRGELRSHGVALEAQLANPIDAVVGDRVQLQQVILNLVMNAIEAMSSAPGRRRLQLASEADPGRQQVTVSVSDTGPGIEFEKLQQIFEPFFTTKSNGMGVGLSICRSIVEAHGGRLWVEPRSETGATFRFTLLSDSRRASIKN